MVTKKRKPAYPWVTEAERKREMKTTVGKVKWLPLEVIFGRRGATRGYLIGEHKRKVRLYKQKKK